jgi:hypothetical protein
LPAVLTRARHPYAGSATSCSDEFDIVAAAESVEPFNKCEPLRKRCAQIDILDNEIHRHDFVACRSRNLGHLLKFDAVLGSDGLERLAANVMGAKDLAFALLQHLGGVIKIGEAYKVAN